MKNNSKVHKGIEDLVTRFFYKEEQLFFRIMVKYYGERMEAFEEYADYNEYKAAYADLIRQKHSYTMKKGQTLRSNASA